MAVPAFDTLRAANILKGAGFDDEQAVAIVYAIQDALRENVAAKSYSGHTDIQTASAKFRADIYRALWIQGGVLVTVMLGIATVAVAIIALIIA